MELKVQSERVQALLSDHPEYEFVIGTLFPEILEDRGIFCKLGSILIRKGHKNFYTIDWNEERSVEGTTRYYLQMYNITHMEYWGNKLYTKQYHDQPVTIGTARTLFTMSGINYKEFRVINYSDIKQ